MKNVKMMTMQELYLEREAHEATKKGILDKMEEVLREHGINPAPKVYYTYREALTDLQKRITEISLEIGERKTEESRAM